MQKKMDDYIKISKYVAVHKQDIECLYPYGNGPAADFVKKAKEKGTYEKSHLKRIMTLIVLKNGQILTGSLSVRTYLSRLDEENFVRADRGAYIRDCLVNKQVYVLNRFYRGQLKEKKDSGCYLKLAGNKTVKMYLFMESGYVYGCRIYRPANNNKQQE